MHRLSKQFIKFFIVGFSGFLIDFSILNFLVYVLDFRFKLFDYVLMANIVSASLAVLYVFYYQKNWTFRRGGSQKIKSEFISFMALQLFNLIFFNGLVFSSFINLANIPIPIAKVLTAAIQVASSFLAMKHFVFHRETGDGAA